MGALKTGYIGGMVFYGRGTDVFPLWSAPYNAGTVYLRTSQRLNLGGLAGPGKLMGLSSYGSGAFHHDRFVGDYTETADAFMGDARPTMSTTVDNLYVMIPKWLEHLWEKGGRPPSTWRIFRPRACSPARSPADPATVRSADDRSGGGCGADARRRRP